MVGVAGQVAGHVGQLDDRPQADAEEPVVDPVDAAEVVHRPAVDLPVGAEVVAEDAVGAHGGHPQLVVDDAQGLGELLADHRPPVVSVLSMWLRCSEPIMGRQGRCSGPAAGPRPR